MRLTGDLPRCPQVKVSLWCKQFLETFSFSYQLDVNNSIKILVSVYSR